MKIKNIIGVTIWISVGLLAVALPEMAPRQTAVEIQVQKDLANQAPLQGVPEDSKTPLKLFEKYFAALARVDASEFDCFTKRGIEIYFDRPGDFTEESRKRLSDKAKANGEKGHKLVGFWFHEDVENPSIVFAYMYAQNGETTEPVWSYEEVKLKLIKTENGWKIDQLTELRGW